MSSLRDLPSVDQLLQQSSVIAWITKYGRSQTIEALRQSLEATRTVFSKTQKIPSDKQLLEQAHELLQAWSSPSLRPVINATGVILHTNLGRAPLSRSAIHAIQAIALGYSNLEYDLEKGQRGSRLLHAETLLTRLTGAESALVVNNNAAAVLLVLSAFARRRSVVISRTQLVEIGGGFRIPEIMQQSGAHLYEIGTTNRVNLDDYAIAIRAAAPAIVLRVHRSNFRLSGFTSEPTLAELAMIAHQAGIPLVDDLGSGALLDTAKYGLGHEPTVSESVGAGADLVCFSGDKLLGGPQAGIIIGREDLISKLKKHPLARAVRADKLCLAGLSATLLQYLKDQALQEIPIWQMISATPDTLHSRVGAWVKILGCGEVMASQSTVGGGSLPDESLPTFVFALAVDSASNLLDQLRKQQTPIIARMENNRIVFDPRTVLPEQDEQFLSALHSILKTTSKG